METSERNLPDDGAPKRRLNSSIVAVGVAFGLTLAGLGVAAAQTDSSSGSTTTTAPTTAAPSDSGSSGSTAPADHPARPAEALLTGDAAAKVSAAALAAVPGGTILRVETDSGGSPYEAHVLRTDGTEVVVKVNEAFEVTATEEGGGPGCHGHHGPRPGDGGAEQETG